MITISIGVNGQKETVANLGRMSEKVKKAIKEEIGASALRIQASAKRRCPVRTGALRNSITVDLYGEMSAEIAPHMPYAIFVEFGTRKMRARPYMTPAAEEERPRLAKELELIVDTGLK